MQMNYFVWCITTFLFWLVWKSNIFFVKAKVCIKRLSDYWVPEFAFVLIYFREGDKEKKDDKEASVPSVEVKQEKKSVS